MREPRPWDAPEAVAARARTAKAIPDDAALDREPRRRGARRAAVAATPAPAEDRLTEAGAAERFARRHGDDVRFDHRRARWLIYGAHRWAPDGDGAITRRALGFVREWQREAVEIGERDRREATLLFVLRLERREALASMLKLAADLPPIADAGDDWDPDPWLLGVSNGVVDLRTGALRAGRRSDRITLSAAAAFDPTARSATWDAALRAIFPSADQIAFVQTALGYSATGDTGRDCWFLASGSGRNGKSTVLHAARRSLGDYACELPAAVLDARRDSAPYDLAVLPGKRLVLSSESGDTIKLHHDRIKQLSGGDALRAANKYERSFEFQPACKLWLAANRKPRVDDDSPAFWARVMLIDFPVSFAGREDRALRPALEHDPAHQAAILAWLVAGAVRHARDGLDAPDAVRRATAAYRAESDPLAEFLDEATERDPDAEIAASDLYTHYRQWADRHGLTERERLGAIVFGRTVAARFERQHTRAGKVYRGLARRLP